MIPNSLMRFPPPPVAEVQPKLWKSLGVVLQDQSGYVEAHYAMARMNDDLDPDTEADLRKACRDLYGTLVASGVLIDPAVHYVLQYGKVRPRVRLAIGEHGVLTFAGGRQ